MTMKKKGISGIVEGYSMFINITYQGGIVILSEIDYHMSLEQNLTIRSHDGGKEGHFFKLW